MNICPNYHAFCDKYGATNCGGDCTKCRDNAESGMLTLGELASLYRQYAETHTNIIRPHTAAQNIGALHRMMCTMGLTDAQKLSVLTPELLQQYADKLTDTHQPCSILGALTAITNLTSAKAIAYYKAQGKEVSPIKKPSIRGNYAPWKSLTKTEKGKLKDLLFSYRNLDDPRKWLAMTMAWCYGMRKSDVLRLKWSANFIEDGERKYLDYTANKTGKRITWPIDDDTWRELMRVKPILMSLRRQHMTADTADSCLRIREHNRNECATSSIWNEIAKDLRRVMGWTGAKALHNLRKDATDTIFQSYGIDLAEQFSGDTERILRKSYVGKKIVPDNIQSILKI